jgi:hypothetical protein
MKAGRVVIMMSKERTYECIWRFFNKKYYAVPENMTHKDFNDEVIDRIYGDIIENNHIVNISNEKFRKIIWWQSSNGKTPNLNSFIGLVIMWQSLSVIASVWIYIAYIVASIDQNCKADTRGAFLVSALTIVSACMSIFPLIRRFILGVKEEIEGFIFKAIKLVFWLSILFCVGGGISYINNCMSSAERIDNFDILIKIFGYSSFLSFVMINFGAVIMISIRACHYAMDEWINTSDVRSIRNIDNSPNYLKSDLTILPDKNVMSIFEKSR